MNNICVFAHHAALWRIKKKHALCFNLTNYNIYLKDLLFIINGNYRPY